MMWNSNVVRPTILQAKAVARLPSELRGNSENSWGRANMPGAKVDSFLEGPAFDRQGNLYLVDIPNGRILRLTPHLKWEIVAETGGWPNGITIDQEGLLWVADYRLGLLRVDPSTGAVETVLNHRNSEGFKGLNDLVFDDNGHLYFTDQGQTGLHDPSGRVYRLRRTGQLDELLHTVPSPNGIALDPTQKFLFVSATRANAVWRMPLHVDGSISKVGAFHTFFGTSGPDGLAMGSDGSLMVAHASLGVFALDPKGWITHYVHGSERCGITNLAFRPGTCTAFLTESETGSLLEVEFPCQGASLFSHSLE